MLGKSDARGILAATFAAFCWGAATVMSKSALHAVSPLALLVLQLGFSVAALWAVILLTRRPLPVPRTSAALAALGLLEPGTAYLLGLIGLVSVGAGVATLIQASEAIMIVLVAAILLRQKPASSLIVLSLVALGGLLVALGVFDAPLTESTPSGVALIFLATASAAVYVVLSSRLIGDHDPLVAVGLQQLSALVLALAVLPLEATLSPAGIVLPGDAHVWLVVAVSGLVQYALAFSAYMYALTRIDANMAGSFLNLTPVFGLAIAYGVLGETMSVLQLLGAAVTIAAVSLVHLHHD